MRTESRRHGKEVRRFLPHRFSCGPLVMGGLRSSGNNTLGLRGRHKCTLRQGPLVRREEVATAEEEEEERVTEERESVAGLICCRVEGKQFRAKPSTWVVSHAKRKVNTKLFACCSKRK